MNYDERPWLKSYDEWVDPDFIAPDQTYVELIEGVFDDFPDRAAFHFMGRSMTFFDLDEESRRFAKFLREAGAGGGDVVGINLPNTPQYIIAIAGALRAGCAVSGVSPLLTGKEMVHQLNDSEARVLVTLDAIFENRFAPLASEAKTLTHVIATGIADYMPSLKGMAARLLKKVPAGKVFPIPGKTVMGFKEVIGKYPAERFDAGIAAESTALVQYTGGTTGLPKGAMLSHRNVVNNQLQLRDWVQAERGREVLMTGFPLFHVAGLLVGMASMAQGNTQVLIPDPRNTGHIAAEFKKYRPTLMGHVPSLYQLLLDDPAFTSLDFGPVRASLSGAAPLAPELFRRLEEVVGAGKILEVYGMTETSPLMTMNPMGGEKKVGAVGVPVQSTYIRIVDLDTGRKQVPLGEEGEVICRAPQVMKGYYNKPEETAHALRELDGEIWLYTGDIGRMEDDGYLTLVDRAKDMLNVSGYKVFSREVEDKLYDHPAIEFVAIVGETNPDRPGSELVKAVIQLKKSHADKDRSAIEKEILEYSKENMAPYKVPKKIVFVDEVPLTTVGKVDKKALR